MEQATLAQALAARGILAQNGASSPFNQAQTVQPQAIVASSPEPTSVAEAIKMMRQGNPGGAMNVTGVTPSVDPLNPSVNTTLPGPTAGGDASDLLPWLIGGGAGVGTYAAAKALSNRRKKPTSKIDDASFGANTGSAPKPGQLAGDSSKKPGIMNDRKGQKRLAAPDTIIEGEWSEVPKAIADQRLPPQLEELPMAATRKEIAARKLRNAAEGSSNSEAIPVKGVVKEGLEAGLSRMLGLKDVLAKNKGLAKTLARRVR